jgi:rod shape-determining protein MreD
MAATPQFRFTRIIWAVVPTLTVATAIFFTILPYGQVWGRFPTPALALIPIYYWTIHRPQLIPPAVVFLLGLAQDFATAGPVGLWPVVYLITYSVTLSQRTEIEGLPMRFAWAAFAGVTLLGLFVGWFGASIYNGGFLSAVPMALQALTTAVLFPILGWPLVFIEGEITATMRH